MSFAKNIEDNTVLFGSHGKGRMFYISDGSKICIAEFEPGWNWASHMKSNTDSCKMSHTGYCLQGRMHIDMDDGNSFDINEGDVFHIQSGHHANTEVFTKMIDFHSDGLTNLSHA